MSQATTNPELDKLRQNQAEYRGWWSRALDTAGDLGRQWVELSREGAPVLAGAMGAAGHPGSRGFPDRPTNPSPSPERVRQMRLDEKRSGKTRQIPMQGLTSEQADNVNIAALASLNAIDRGQSSPSADDDIGRLLSVHLSHQIISDPKSNDDQKAAAARTIAEFSAERSAQAFTARSQAAQTATQPSQIADRAMELLTSNRGNLDKTTQELVDEGWDGRLITPELLSNLKQQKTLAEQAGDAAKVHLLDLTFAQLRKDQLTNALRQGDRPGTRSPSVPQQFIPITDGPLAVGPAAAVNLARQQAGPNKQELGTGEEMYRAGVRWLGQKAAASGVLMETLARKAEAWTGKDLGTVGHIVPDALAIAEAYSQLPQFEASPSVAGGVVQDDGSISLKAALVQGSTMAADMGVGLGAGAVASLVASPAVGAMVSTAIMGGLDTTAVMQQALQDELARGASYDDAYSVAATTGAVYAPVSLLLEKIPIGEYFAKNPAANRALTEFAAKAFRASTKESATETAQQIWQDVSHYIAREDPEIFKDWETRYGSAAAWGAALGGLGGPVMNAAGEVIETSREGRAKAAEAKMAEARAQTTTAAAGDLAAEQALLAAAREGTGEAAPLDEPVAAPVTTEGQEGTNAPLRESVQPAEPPPAAVQQNGPAQGAEGTAPSPAAPGEAVPAAQPAAPAETTSIPEPATPNPAPKAPGIADRAIATADRIEQAARSRMAARARQVQEIRAKSGGRGIGATTLPGDIVDHAAILAARAIRAGAYTARAIRTVAIDDLNIAADAIRPVRAAAAKLVRSSLVKGTPDDAMLERAIGHMYELADTGRMSRAAVDRSTGVTKPGDKTITERQALKGRLTAEQRAASRAFAEATRQTRAQERARAKAEIAQTVERIKKQALTARLRGEERVGEAAFRLGKAEGVEQTKARQARVDELRAQVTQIIQDRASLRERGRLLKAVQNVQTPTNAIALLKRVDRAITAESGREAVRDLRRLTSPKRLARLTNERRSELQGLRSRTRDLLKRLGKADETSVIPASHEAQAAVDRAREIIQEHRNENKVILGNRVAEASTLRSDIVQRVESQPAIRSRRKAGEAPSEESGTFRSRAALAHWTPETLAMRIDNAQHGPAQRVLRALQNGRRKRLGMVFDVQSKVEESARRHGLGTLADVATRLRGELGPRRQATVDVSKIGGLGGHDRISLDTALKILALDPETRAKALDGQTFNFAQEPSAEPFRLTPEVFDFLENNVPKEAQAFMRDLKKIREDEIRPPLFKAHRRLKGYEPPVVQDYEPIVRNTQQRASEGFGEFTTSQADLNRHLENLGFLQSRTGGSTPILLRGFTDDFLRGLDTAASVAHMAEPIRAWEMTLQHPEVMNKLVTRYGPEVRTRIRDIAGEASQVNRLPQASTQRLLRQLTGNVGKALTSINPSSFLRQIGGVFKIQSEMPPQAFIDGVRGAFTPGVYERMVRNSPILRDRMRSGAGSLVFGLNEGVEPYGIGADAARESVRNLVRAVGNAATAKLSDAAIEASQAYKNLHGATNAIRAAAWFDAIPARVAWAGFEAEAARRMPRATPEERQRWVARRAEQAVERTQNTYDPLNTSGATASARKGGVLGSFLQFTADANKSYNMLAQARLRGRKQFVRTAMGIALNAAWSVAVGRALRWGVAATAAAAVGNQFGDEERKAEALDGIGWQFLNELGGTVYGVDRVVQFAAATLGGKDALDAIDAPVLGMARDALAGISQMGSAINQAVSDDPTERQVSAADKFLKGLGKLALSGSGLAGVPVLPTYYLGRRAVRAASRTPVQDFMYERRELSKQVGKGEVSDRARRLRRLDAFYSRVYAPLMQASRKRAALGDKKGATELLDRLNERAADFMGGAREEASASP